MRHQQANDAKLILWTCRDGEKLTKAVEWCKLRGLEFDAVNQNLPEVIEQYGGDTRKISADEYIDDKMCNRFKLPFVSQRKEITANPKKITSFGDAEIAVIEAFIGKDGPIMEFKEMQALVAMQFEIYKRMMQPTYILQTGALIGKPIRRSKNEKGET